MNDESNGQSGAILVILSLVALTLVGGVSWILYNGSVQFGNRHPTLHDAVGAGNMNDMKSYIAENSNLLESRDSHGELPIHHAIKYRQPNALKYLMDQGANVDGKYYAQVIHLCTMLS